MAEFKNPNQAGGSSSGGGQSSSSFLLMIVVMFGVLFGLQYWRAKHNPQTQDESATAQHATTAPQSAAGTTNSPVAPLGTSTSAQAISVPAVQATGESSTVVENDVYRITFSNRGAQVSSWVLKKFKDVDGNPLDLVHEGASRQFGFPLSLYTYDPALTAGLAQALYVPSASGTLTAPATLSFKYSFGNVSVEKTFTFSADYVIHADALVTRNGAPVRALLSWPAGFGDMETAAAYASAQVDTSAGGKTEHQAFKSVSGGATLNGAFDFAGTSDQYFAAVFLPDHPQDATVATLHGQIDVSKVQRHPGAKGVPSKGALLVPVVGAAVGDLNGHDEERLFVGPKSIHVLKSIPTANGGTLEPVLDFGFWGYLGKFLFYGLQAVHRWIAPTAATAATARDYSWGWAVLLFTVIINLVLLPLRVQSMKSAVKMQRIQPQVDLIKAKYKNPKPTDPKAAEMNAEVMAYQKSQGVSMLGGCIPTVIQLPLLIAFYTMMTRVVELRQAHWFWLHDLSASDPHFIKVLPILMVVTQFLVQYYTPMPGQDPQQQKMMAFMMPLFSGYITWNYASGLALYWTAGNIINIIQQQVMNRTSLGREMREIALKRAAAKAQQKTGAGGLRAGGGKVIQGKR